MNRSRPRTEKLAFVAGPSPEAQSARARLSARYGEVAPEKADVVVPLGGDGFMLRSLHRLMSSGKPIYGMHRGTVGFLMNEYQEEGLKERIAAAEPTVIHPLRMRAHDVGGVEHEYRAINEVSVFRESYQAARLRILIDGKERLADLVADGLLIATPAGSTAYNLSVQGPVLPINAPLLALTPISPFRPRRWRGALIPDDLNIQFRVLDPGKRPVSAVADQIEVRDVATVDVCVDRTDVLTLLFDPEHALDERITMEQFAV